MREGKSFSKIVAIDMRVTPLFIYLSQYRMTDFSTTICLPLKTMAKKSEPSRKNFWPNNKSNSEESNADDESNASS
jgi:hypothetical protein